MVQKTFMKRQVCECFRQYSSECVCCHLLQQKLWNDMTLKQKLAAGQLVCNKGPWNLADAKQINMKRGSVCQKNIGAKYLLQIITQCFHVQNFFGLQKSDQLSDCHIFCFLKSGFCEPGSVISLVFLQWAYILLMWNSLPGAVVNLE